MTISIERAEGVLPRDTAWFRVRVTGPPDFEVGPFSLEKAEAVRAHLRTGERFAPLEAHVVTCSCCALNLGRLCVTAGSMLRQILSEKSA